MGTEFMACYRCYTKNTAKISPYLSKEAKNITVSNDGRHRVNESIKITFFTQVPHKLMINKHATCLCNCLLKYLSIVIVSAWLRFIHAIFSVILFS